MDQTKKSCQNCSKSFVIDQDDIGFYEKINVPFPTFCPPCRLQRRLAFRNERTLYKKPCGLCNKEVVTMYSPEGGINSFCSPCFWSDNWDPMEYGREYDFSKPFFIQLRELMERVPHQNLIGAYKTWINTEFANMNHELKNCYLLFNSDYDENCMYSEEVEHSKDCMDVTMIESSELMYESVNCAKCYRTHFSTDCESSHDIWFSKNLTGCSHCFGCVGLRKRTYCIFNEEVGKEEYELKLAEFGLGSHTSIQKMKNKAESFWLNFPNKYIHGVQNKEVSGEYINNSKNVRDSYIVLGSEDCRYCMWLILGNNKNCYDFTQFGENAENSYEILTGGKNISDVIGGNNILDSRSVRYSMFCASNCHDIFGCMSLRSKEYCILNRQYSREEYEKLIPKITEHMQKEPYKDSRGRTYGYGEFFPAEISQFAYNETTANEFFPLSPETARSQGHVWKDMKEKAYAVTTNPAHLPDNIKDVKDDILDQVVGCEHEGTCNHQCTTAFRIIKPELQFYRSMGLPLPHLCPNCRHHERTKKRNPIPLNNRECQCAGEASENGKYKNTARHFHENNPCPNAFQTSYPSDARDIVYCQDCYQAETA